MTKRFSEPTTKADYEFAKKRPVFERFTQKLHKLMAELLETANIQYVTIFSRTKTVESFSEKIRRPGKFYANPLADVTDLSGLQIVLLRLADVDCVVDIIKKEFTVDEKNSIDKRKLLEPNELGYMAVQYVVTLSPSRARLLEWKAFQGLKAEIQIHTALHHAWATVSRPFLYKTSADVPKELQRRIFRVMGLLELADEQLESFRKEETTLKQKIREALKQGKPVEIDVNTIVSFLEDSSLVRDLMKKVSRAGFATADELDRESLSDLMGACERAGFSRISDLENFLGTHSKIAESFLSRLNTHVREAARPWRVGPAHTILFLLVGFRLSPDYLLKRGWPLATVDILRRAIEKSPNV